MGFFKKAFGLDSRSPNSARDYYESGLALERNKADHTSAIADFSEAIRLDPNFADAHYARAFAHEVLGHFAQAIADFNAVIRLAPTAGDELVVEVGETPEASRVMRLGRLGESDEELDVAAVIQHGTGLDIARVSVKRGMASADNGEFDQAIDDFSDAIRLDPKPATYFERGQAYCQVGRFQEAIGDLLKTAQSNPKEPEWLFHIYFLLGDAYRQVGNHDKAIFNLGIALRYNQADARAYFSRGRAYWDKKDSDRAIADLSEAIRLDFDHAGSEGAFAFRGEAYSEKGDHDRAIADFTSAIRFQPLNPGIFGCRALAHHEKGEHKKALADLNEVIRLSSEDPQPYRFRAQVYRALGDEMSARNDERSAQAAVYLAQALTKMQQDNWDQAIALLQQVLELHPSMHKAYLRRGIAYLARHEPDKAIADFNHLIQNKPTPKAGEPLPAVYPDALASRGDAFAMKKDFDQAIADFSEALRLEPRLAPVYEKRARAYRAVGDLKKAAADESQAEKLSGFLQEKSC
jgi:tetratricopeptide (TPR) repeat protein